MLSIKSYDHDEDLADSVDDIVEYCFVCDFLETMCDEKNIFDDEFSDKVSIDSIDLKIS